MKENKMKVGACAKCRKELTLKSYHYISEVGKDLCDECFAVYLELTLRRAEFMRELS